MPNSTSLGVFLLCGCTLLAICVIAGMVRAITGHRFTDRIVAVNLIGTITIVIMCLLSVYFDEAFLVDITIVYALLSFIAIVVLTRLVIVRRRAQEEKELAEARQAGGTDTQQKEANAK